MPEIFDSIWNGPSRYVVIVIVAFIILYIPVMIYQVKKRKGNAQKFLLEHPNAATVLIKGAVNGSLNVLTVNGERANVFNKGMSAAFYLIPGENVIKFQYTWSRPGVMYKTVTTTVGPVKVTVKAESETTYNFSYDHKAEKATFEALTS